MILVTGANGLLGSYLVKMLLQKGEKVRGLKRKNSDLSLLGDYASKVEWVEGDVTDIFSIEEAMVGIQKVYHCAAMISFVPEDIDQMMLVNVEGTANVVNAALDAGVEKLLHVSSVAAFGRPKPEKIIDEQIEIKDSKDNFHYYRSKFYGEREVWRAHAEGLNVVIINPSTILGGGFWQLPPNHIFKQIQEGLPFYTEGVNGFVDVRDVAEVALKLMESTISGEKFIVSAGNLSFKELMTSIADALGVSRPKYKAGKLLGGIAWRAEWLKAFFTKQKPMITRETVEMAQNDFYYSNEKIINALSYSFRPIPVIVKDTAALLQKSKQEKKPFGVYF